MNLSCTSFRYPAHDIEVAPSLGRMPRAILHPRASTHLGDVRTAGVQHIQDLHKETRGDMFGQ